MDKKLWKFTGSDGRFASDNANLINTLYFPLCNNSPIRSSISPDLHGDLKKDFNSFLLQPLSRIGLSNLKSSRNFWIYINKGKVWSATGVSKDISTKKLDKFKLEAGPLWHKVTRSNKRIGLAAEITSFIPAGNDPVEIMQVKLHNISSRPISLIPTAAIPVYARSASNLHDHRHVTSLLARTEITKYGTITTPTLSFDEAGHRKNKLSYFVYAVDQNSRPAAQIYSTYEDFCGEGSDLEWPDAVSNDRPPLNKQKQGREVVSGIKFRRITLKPDQSFSYIILLGIVNNPAKATGIMHKFNNLKKVESALFANQRYWQKLSCDISVQTPDINYNNWLRWVTLQPTLRRIFGCSFLPDFDYGKGGRGWRDLWQDCLCLILTSAEKNRKLLINNFKGVRIDGSNATIIGDKPGEFRADRNNIIRVWMDHGIWPLLTTDLYINQSGDFNLLFEKISYFRDMHTRRGKKVDLAWKIPNRNQLKTKNKKVYKGTILEHLLVENLVQFFNVGPHNQIRLENADWNDGLDMAAEFGESVAFSAMYAHNLDLLSKIIDKLPQRKIAVFKELSILLGGIFGKGFNYSDMGKKTRVLDNYLSATEDYISGKTIYLRREELVVELKKKALWLKEHIRKQEWVKPGFYNGYYNNKRQRVGGKFGRNIRMTLTGQVFPITSGVATEAQIKTIFKNMNRYLKSREFGGFRLNTDFKSEQLHLGRAFSFIYGDKENGAFFNHMSIMCAHALYQRGFVKEGRQIFDSLYRMAGNSRISKVYPCLPEYFNSDGRGMYSYLTGSASWYILTLLTQAFGIKGCWGDLVIEPKLTAREFRQGGEISVNTSFANKAIKVVFINRKRREFGRYLIRAVKINGKLLKPTAQAAPVIAIQRRKFLMLAKKRNNRIEVTLD